MVRMHSRIYSTHHYRLLTAFHALALGLTALHLYAATLPATATPIPTPEDAESAWWGVWPITYVATPLLWIGAAVILLLVIGGWWWMRYGRPVGSTTGSIPDHWLWPAAALIFVSFWVFPIVHTRWGDAYILANGISWPDAALRLTHSWQAPLDVYLHSRVWHWLNGPLGWTDAIPVYRLLSPIAGGLFLWITLRLSADRRIAPNWVTFGLLASLGLIQLFFGYIENYSFAAAGILAYLWIGLGVLRGERSLWLAATILAVTNATHPSTVIYLPSLLYLAYHQWAVRRRPGAQVVAVSIPMIGVAALTILLMESGGHGILELLGADRPGGGDGRWFVPLIATSTRWEHYTMFSWLHVRDFLNGQMLVAPVILPTLLVGGIGTIWGRDRLELETEPLCKRAVLFLLTAAGFHLLLTWIWNPDYGGQRDLGSIQPGCYPNSAALDPHDAAPAAASTSAPGSAGSVNCVTDTTHGRLDLSKSTPMAMAAIVFCDWRPIFDQLLHAARST